MAAAKATGKTTPVAIRMADDLLGRVDAEREHLGEEVKGVEFSRADVIRVALEEWLAAREEERQEVAKKKGGKR